MRRVIAAACFFFVATATAGAETFGKYGVTVQVPQGFQKQPPPGNDDGRRFIDRNGAEIRVWGGWRIDSLADNEAGMRDYYQEVGGVVTYDTRGNGWYVLSGYFGQSIFYLRVENGQLCGGGEARASMEFIYPQDSRESYDPMVGRLAESVGFEAC